MSELPHVTIYTDGACIPNPGPGGWAVLLRYGDIEKVLSGAEPDTTNQRMELTAVLRALEALKEPCKIDLYTDSQYLKRGVTEWLPVWRAQNWQSKGRSLANLDLWQALDAVCQRHQVEWHWVRGHDGNPENQRVDRLARQAARLGRVV